MPHFTIKEPQTTQKFPHPIFYNGEQYNWQSNGGVNTIISGAHTFQGGPPKVGKDWPFLSSGLVPKFGATSLHTTILCRRPTISRIFTNALSALNEECNYIEKRLSITLSLLSSRCIEFSRKEGSRHLISFLYKMRYSFIKKKFFTSTPFRTSFT